MVNFDEFNKQILVKSYGVHCAIWVNTSRAIQPIRQVILNYLPGCTFVEAERQAQHEFFYRWNSRSFDSLYKRDETIEVGSKRGSLLETLGSKVRITIAEHAIGRVFIHAGSVGWKGKAIIIPGRSFRGKSALTAELVRLGALYYSDEYAILDQKGRVHPFPKELSLRGIKNDYVQVDHPVEALGGKAGKRPIPVGMVVITEYKKGAKWRPRIVSPGPAAMELINNAVPIRRDPQFALPILSKVATEAQTLRSKRGEASVAAKAIIEAIEDREPSSSS